MRRHIWKRRRRESSVLWMEAKPRGSVGRQGRLIIALVSLNFVLYINHVHRHAHVRTRVYYGALVVYAPEIMIRHDGGHDPFWSSSSSSTSSARGCEFRTAKRASRLPLSCCRHTCVCMCVCMASHTTSTNKLPREEHLRVISELDTRQINRTRAWCTSFSPSGRPFFNLTTFRYVDEKYLADCGTWN